MITKYQHGAYWHLYFNEECADEPRAVLEQVEKLFKEIGEMGDLCYFRVRPKIERIKEFEGGTCVRVICRLSTPAPDAPDPSVFSGLRESAE